MSTTKSARATTKQALRNFQFVTPADKFLVDEAERTGKTMTVIVEQGLLYLKSLKPAARDALLSNLKRV